MDWTVSFALPYRDVNARSLRSNAVLRWEWAQGSTLFVVWQQDRYRERSGGRRIRPWALGETPGVEGDNFLALKVTYWLDL